MPRRGIEGAFRGPETLRWFWWLTGVVSRSITKSNPPPNHPLKNPVLSPMEIDMRPLYRKPVNKRRSVRSFKNVNRRTNVRNVSPPPMRGGIRM